jgi:hypothetical protein
MQSVALTRITGLIKRFENTPLYLKLLQMGAVTHVLTLHEAGQQDLQPVAVLPGVFENPIRVYRVPDPLPRTYVIGESRILTHARALERLSEPGWDPHRELILMEGAAAAISTRVAGTARVVSERADRVEVEARLDAPGFVVLVDSYDPSWRATVDGSEVPILRANLAFRAVAVEAGTHTITFSYRPSALTIGLASSATTALLAIGALVASRRRQ